MYSKTSWTANVCVCVCVCEREFVCGCVREREGKKEREGKRVEQAVEVSHIQIHKGISHSKKLSIPQKNTEPCQEKCAFTRTERLGLNPL